jgi:hypothetical protein
MDEQSFLPDLCRDAPPVERAATGAPARGTKNQISPGVYPEPIEEVEMTGALLTLYDFNRQLAGYAEGFTDLTGKVGVFDDLLKGDAGQFKVKKILSGVTEARAQCLRRIPVSWGSLSV